MLLSPKPFYRVLTTCCRYTCAYVLAVLFLARYFVMTSFMTQFVCSQIRFCLVHDFVFDLHYLRARLHSRDTVIATRFLGFSRAAVFSFLVMTLASFFGSLEHCRDTN